MCVIFYWYPDKIPPEKNPSGKNPPEKIPLNAVEHEPVPTRVLNLTRVKRATNRNNVATEK